MEYTVYSCYDGDTDYAFYEVYDGNGEFICEISKQDAYDNGIIDDDDNIYEDVLDDYIFINHRLL